MIVLDIKIFLNKNKNNFINDSIINIDYKGDSYIIYRRLKALVNFLSKYSCFNLINLNNNKNFSEILKE